MGRHPSCPVHVGKTLCPVHAGIHPFAQCMLGYGKQVGGMHPTGMHSCLPKMSKHGPDRSTSTGPNNDDIILSEFLSFLLLFK